MPGRRGPGRGRHHEFLGFNSTTQLGAGPRRRRRLRDHLYYFAPHSRRSGAAAGRRSRERRNRPPYPPAAGAGFAVMAAVFPLCQRPAARRSGDLHPYRASGAGRFKDLFPGHARTGDLRPVYRAGGRHSAGGTFGGISQPLDRSPGSPDGADRNLDPGVLAGAGSDCPVLRQTGLAARQRAP